MRSGCLAQTQKRQTSLALKPVLIRVEEWMRAHVVEVLPVHERRVDSGDVVLPIHPSAVRLRYPADRLTPLILTRVVQRP